MIVPCRLEVWVGSHSGEHAVKAAWKLAENFEILAVCLCVHGLVHSVQVDVVLLPFRCSQAYSERAINPVGPLNTCEPQSGQTCSSERQSRTDGGVRVVNQAVHRRTIFRRCATLADGPAGDGLPRSITRSTVSSRSKYDVVAC